MAGRDSAWESRRVLVTGAGGFVGRWLVQELAGRHARVHGLLSVGSRVSESTMRQLNTTDTEIVRGDVRDLQHMQQIIADAQIDTIYHLAAVNTNVGSDVTPAEIFDTNLRGTFTMLEACRTSLTKPRLVLASSREAETCFSGALDHKHHPYMASKAGAELIARAYRDTFDVPMTLVRCDNVYGGGDFNWARLVPGTIRAICHGEAPTIRTDGTMRRDFVHIDDAVAAYISVGERIEEPSVRGQLFRVATGRHTTALDMVSHLARAAGVPGCAPRVLNQISDERVDSLYTPDFERRVLGWQSRVSLEEGVDRTVRWYREFFEAKVEVQ